MNFLEIRKILSENFNLSCLILWICFIAFTVFSHFLGDKQNHLENKSEENK